MKLLVIIATLVLIFMVLDIVSGLIGAIKNGNYKSQKMREGLYHKIGYILAIMLSALIEYSCKYIDLGFTMPILKPVMCYIILNEIGSIIENLEVIHPGLLPKKIINVLQSEKKESEV